MFAQRYLLTLLVLLALTACAAIDETVDRRASEEPRSILFVGNSFTYYNNSLHNHYRRLVRSARPNDDRPGRVRIMTISGGRLPEHAAAMPAMLASEDWDIVVMQGHSLGPIEDETAGPFQAAARRYAAQIRAVGAEPVFFMTWGYTDRPEMTVLLDAAYTAIGQELDARVVPVGRAFADVTEHRPDIDLRTADARHPTLAGTYLAACTFFAAFYSESPEGLDYTAGLDTDVARHLQQAAWRAVTEYEWRETQAQ